MMLARLVDVASYQMSRFELMDEKSILVRPSESTKSEAKSVGGEGGRWLLGAALGDGAALGEGCQLEYDTTVYSVLACLDVAVVVA